MKEYLWIGLGSALGGMGRHWASGWVARRLGEGFPVGTVLVNVSGSFLIGLLAAMGDSNARTPLGTEARQFLMIGLMGGYTTFSSFSLQTLTLTRAGQWLPAAGNVLLSVVGCLAAVWLGHALGQALNR